MLSYRIGVVSYLNARPFLHGIKQSEIAKTHQLVVESPSSIAEKLLQNEIDLGLVPVSIIYQMREYQIITNYCIGSEDKVCSVCLYSDTPLEECHTIILDNESRTSVALTKVLLKHHFKLSPTLLQSYTGYENELVGGKAGLVIGDRALMLKDRYNYVNDLGAEWKKMTGLPFVYAAWISNKKLDNDFIKQFDNACFQGIDRRSEIANDLVEYYQGVDVKKYFNDCISYELDDRKRKGLELFLKYSAGL